MTSPQSVESIDLNLPTIQRFCCENHMENLAFLYNSQAHEDLGPEPQLRTPEEFAKISGAAVAGLVGSVAAATVLTNAPEASAVVRRGDICPAVGQVQSALQSSGFYGGGSVDDIFGGGTEDAVVAFQRARGLSQDGIVGPQTADALGLGDAENPNSPFLFGNSCTGGTVPPPITQEVTGVVSTYSGAGILTRSSPDGGIAGNGFGDGELVYYDLNSRTSAGGYTWVLITSGRNSGYWVAEDFLIEDFPGPPIGQEASGIVSASSGLYTRSSPNGSIAGDGFVDGETVFYDPSSATFAGGYTWVLITSGRNSGYWVALDFIGDGFGPPIGQEASGIVSASSGLYTRSSPNGSIAGSGFADGAIVFYDPSSATFAGGYTWVLITSGANTGYWVALDFLY
ncbi:MAG: peptidoglycan-binding protein [Cyanobacteria bacterium CRU_2_1]|nr:peptidoglycan-binding protein [Cyanobacteria bacterium CRU_2_1]